MTAFRSGIENRVILFGSRAIAAVFALIALLFILSFPASAVGTINVAVSPDQVDRYQVFVITVTTAFPNTTFDLEINGPGYALAQNRTTDAVGLWRQDLSAAFDFGTYTVFVAAGNDSAQATLTVGCSPRCVVDIQNTWGLSNRELIAAGIVQIVIVVTVALLVTEGPKAAHYFWKTGVQAVKRGQLTFLDRMKSPLAVFHGFVQPGRQSMRADVNDRIAMDLERRALIEEMHEATRARFLEYDPDQWVALRDIFNDLDQAYGREARVIANPPPVAHKYDRPVGRHSMATNAEFAEDSVWLAKAGLQGNPEPGREATDFLDVGRSQRRVRARGRWYVAIGAAVLIGIPSALVAILGELAYGARVYVEPFRSMWQPWMNVGRWLDGVLALIVVVLVVAVLRSRAALKKAA